MAGRKKIVFDLIQVERLARIQCTRREMAAVLGISVVTLQDRIKHDAAFAEAVERGQEMGKASLRRKQYHTAMGGNTAMLIWLGKQWLGQTEKIEQEQTVRQFVAAIPEEAKSVESWEQSTPQ